MFEYFNIYRQINSYIKYFIDLEATKIIGYSFVKEKCHPLQTDIYIDIHVPCKKFYQAIKLGRIYIYIYVYMWSFND